MVTNIMAMRHGNSLPSHHHHILGVSGDTRRQTTTVRMGGRELERCPPGGRKNEPLIAGGERGSQILWRRGTVVAYCCI